MASGQGKRFGGNKLMADFGGTPMLQWILMATEGIFSRRVVVTRHPDVAAFCRVRNIDVLLHDLPHRSDTVRLGLEALGMDLSGCMFCPGDQPLLTQASVQTLAHRFTQEPEYIWRLAWGEEGGTPVLFPRWTFPQLLDLPEGKGGKAVLQKNPEQVRLVPARKEYELWDVDSPEDLNQLLRCLER